MTVASSKDTKHKAEDELLNFRKSSMQQDPFFLKMFKGGFQEAITNSASFPEDSPGSFDILITWVYHGKLRPLTRVKDNRNALAWKVISLYSLTEKLCSFELMDDIMDAFRDFGVQNDSLPSCYFILTTYQKFDSNSPLRRYVCYCYTYVLLNEKRDTGHMTDLLTTVPDLASEMAKLLRETGGFIPEPKSFSYCHFHTHHKYSLCPWEL
ncbi:hypothetical protein LSUB1_G003277 [Lachnellula subtilissima]|uniref:BTB domain-containing protein n=1 Tax=Lachnellula subtilissima TaxID=602034 RepID=A0A8H8UF01_9HELO|nr:hypothetical protein LSUB1_G003277 [Lachnellula subtilissima]